MGRAFNNQMGFKWVLLIPVLAIFTGSLTALWLIPVGVTFVLLLSGGTAAQGMGIDHGDTDGADSPFGFHSLGGSALGPDWRTHNADAFSDSDWPSNGLATFEPAFNIDGTPMLGAFDIHGNPYGVTTNTQSFGFLEPSVNIDGTPMVGSVDIHGHPYGVTDSSSWDMGSSSSMHDSWNSSDTFSSTGMTDSWSGGSGIGCGSSHWD